MTTRSRHLVDRELLGLLDALPTQTITADNLAAFRASPTVAVPPPALPGAAEVQLSIEHAPGADGAPAVPFRVYRPAGLAGPVGCAVHIHGGGFLRGSADIYEPFHRNFAASLGCVVVSVDYRLAPETAFPGNVEDCYAALDWVFGHAAELSVDPARIGVIGESAGGGLAACLCLLARDRGRLKPAFQHLMYPMLDDRTSSGEPHPYTGDYIWNNGSNHFGWSSLLGQPPGSPGVSPYAAAARAERLEGLPPAFICVGALDLFLDENLEYARRLARAGVPVELHVYPGAVHAFDFHPVAQVSARAREASLGALRRFLG